MSLPWALLREPPILPLLSHWSPSSGPAQMKTWPCVPGGPWLHQALPSPTHSLRSGLVVQKMPLYTHSTRNTATQGTHGTYTDTRTNTGAHAPLCRTQLVALEAWEDAPSVLGCQSRVLSPSLFDEVLRGGVSAVASGLSLYPCLDMALRGCHHLSQLTVTCY